MTSSRLTPKEARWALVYCAIAFVVSIMLLRKILTGDWDGLYVTSTGVSIPLQYLFAITAAGSLGAFASMLGSALPADWKVKMRRLRHKG